MGLTDMVELVVNNFDYVSKLEWKLNKTNIEYQVCIDMGHYGFKPPYLVVGGVPLDNKRSLKWIEERMPNE